MTRGHSLPSLPALSLEALQEVREIEAYAHEALRDCDDPAHFFEHSSKVSRIASVLFTHDEHRKHDDLHPCKVKCQRFGKASERLAGAFAVRNASALTRKPIGAL
jgi:hypothetical protein